MAGETRNLSPRRLNKAFRSKFYRISTEEIRSVQHPKLNKYDNKYNENCPNSGNSVNIYYVSAKCKDITYDTRVCTPYDVRNTGKRNGNHQRILWESCFDRL